MVREWKNLKDQVRKSLYCHKWRIKGDPSEDSEKRIYEIFSNCLISLDQNFERCGF